jgi:hypothetical protein
LFEAIASPQIKTRRKAGFYLGFPPCISVFVVAEHPAQQQKRTYRSGDDRHGSRRVTIYVAAQAAILVIGFIGKILRRARNALAAFAAVQTTYRIASTRHPAIGGIAGAIGVLPNAVTQIVQATLDIASPRHSVLLVDRVFDVASSRVSEA